MLYRAGYGHMVNWHGSDVDVLSLAGASPDALLVRDAEDGQSEKPIAVVEVKCRVPFLRLASTPGFPGSSTMSFEYVLYLTCTMSGQPES